eukprot:716624-Prorocentrum_minimum.AAC.4
MSYGAGGVEGGPQGVRGGGPARGAAGGHTRGPKGGHLVSPPTTFCQPLRNSYSLRHGGGGSARHAGCDGHTLRPLLRVGAAARGHHQRPRALWLSQGGGDVGRGARRQGARARSPRTLRVIRGRAQMASLFGSAHTAEIPAFLSV